MRVAEVALMGEAEMNLGLVQRVFHLVGVDTGGQAGNDLLALELVSSVEDIVINEDVVAQEVKLNRVQVSIRPTGLQLARTFLFMLMNRPPTVCIQMRIHQGTKGIGCHIPRAARWITWVGLYFSKSFFVCSSFLTST